MENIASLKSYMYDVIGVLHEVHKELGPGLNESCYQEGLKLELDDKKILYQKEMEFHPCYHGKVMSAKFRVDFICKKDIVVELKAVSELSPDNRAQLFNYMRLLKKPCGILVNFFPKNLFLERYFYDKETKEILNIYGQPLKWY